MGFRDAARGLPHIGWRRDGVAEREAGVPGGGENIRRPLSPPSGRLIADEQQHARLLHQLFPPRRSGAPDAGTT